MSICNFCKRDRHFPCRNTRDMCPTDGLNRDSECNRQLALRDGGERAPTLQPRVRRVFAVARHSRLVIEDLERRVEASEKNR